MNPIRLSPFVLLAALAAASPQGARADTTECTQVSTLPATLSQQGVYCLKSNLAASSAAYALVNIAASNITLDCNGRSITQAGTGSEVIHVGPYNNVTIRNCVVRGGVIGISVDGAGQLVEGNQVVGASRIGIYVNPGPAIVRGNRVLAIGGKPSSTFPSGIKMSGRADVIDNTIAGVVAGPGTGHQAIGIDVSSNPGGDVSGNRVSGLLGDGMVGSTGISAGQSPLLSIRGNVVIGDSTGTGIYCTSNGMALATDNRLLDLGKAVQMCNQDDNLVSP